MTEQEIIDGGWIANDRCGPSGYDMFVDTLWKGGGRGTNKRAKCYTWYDPMLLYWRVHKPETQENSATEFKGLESAWDNNAQSFVYPKTNYVTQSDEQLKAAEKDRMENKDNEMLEIVRRTVNSITQKNFSVADIALVANMLKVYKSYEENK